MKKSIKTYLFALFIVSFGLKTNAQTWSTGTSSLYSSPTTTNVGIGTTSPAAKLHLNASSGQDGLRVQLAGSTRFWINSNGGVSIGNYSTPPARGLYVYQSIGIGLISPTGSLDVKRGTGTGGTAIFRGTDRYSHFNYSTAENTYIRGGKTTSNVFINDDGGSVAIGTTYIPSGFRLAVDGGIIAEEVLVELRGNWPDYVFEEDYRLMDLQDLKKYVSEKKHLPGVPAANMVKEQGLNLGEMDAVLLKKIEELTIYVINLQEENTDLKKRIENLENQ